MHLVCFPSTFTFAVFVCTLVLSFSNIWIFKISLICLYHLFIFLVISNDSVFYSVVTQYLMLILEMGSLLVSCPTIDQVFFSWSCFPMVDYNCNICCSSFSFPPYTYTWWVLNHDFTLHLSLVLQGNGTWARRVHWLSTLLHYNYNFVVPISLSILSLLGMMFMSYSSIK